MPDFFENTTPPPGFQNAGSVTIEAPTVTSGPIVIDNVVTPGSLNAVSSGAVAEAIADFVIGGGTESQYIKGNGEKGNLQEDVEAIVDNLGITTGDTDLSDYVTETALDAALGLAITAPINLTAQTATRYTTYTQTIARSVFSLSTGNAAVSLLFAPAGCAVVIGESNVTITWTPITTGENYILFWVSNEAIQGRPASLKITVAATSTITPIDGLVLAAAPLSAGMLVNIYDDNGTPKMRPALATALGTIAHAFVTGNVAAGETLVPKYTGVNPHLTGLQVGKRYFLSTTTPGGVALFGPAEGTGHVWQPVGVAISETELNLDIDEEIVRSAD
jgi:hypothetical protein